MHSSDPRRGEDVNADLSDIALALVAVMGWDRMKGCSYEQTPPPPPSQASERQMHKSLTRSSNAKKNKVKIRSETQQD